MGIIGSNGAGKSTILKIISRITEPTEGHLLIQGRVGSLLEVGVGFHQELTGRENIYLNGSILGMKRPEIQAKLDEIVDFSEIEQFIDTPVKHYSSGMYVRLAFAVAAHLEPDILLVDEVLSVGDLAFQKKSLGKMGQISKSGRTVLFVSHNMGVIQNLCTQGLVLQRGHITFEGPIQDAVKAYLSELDSIETANYKDHPERNGNGLFQLEEAYIIDEFGRRSKFLVGGKPVSIVFAYDNPHQISRVHLAFTIYNQLGIAVTNFDMHINDPMFENLPFKREVHL